MKTFQIPETKKNDFEAKMNKFAKRAAKLNIEFGFDLVSTEQAFYQVETSFGTWEKVYYTVYNYTVRGESPTINGFSFLAKIEPLNSETNLVHSHNSEFDFSAYRSASLTCEHCHTNRQRNFYYLILHDETNTVKIVGRNCLAQYIGLPNAEEIAEFYAGLLGDLSLEEQSEENDFYGSFRSGATWLSIETVLKYTVWAVRKYGFVSRKAQEESYGQKLSTSNVVMSMIFEVKMGEKINWTGDEEQKAQDIISKLSAELSGRNEYECTLKALLSNKLCKFAHLGYVCSMVATYNRMIEQEVNNKNQNTSEYLGEEKQKISDITATVTYCNQFRSDFGWTYMYVFNSNGNSIKYTTATNFDVQVGSNVIIKKATIKKLDTFNGKKQTVITRATIEVAA